MNPGDAGNSDVAGQCAESARLVSKGGRMSGRIERGVWVTYLRTGAALAVLRVSLFVWVEYRVVTHTMTAPEYSLLWGLQPEAFLGEYTSVGAIHFDSLTLQFLFLASLLTLGSFIIAMPILLVASLIRRRR
jgi:hypothetical protein